MTRARMAAVVVVLIGAVLRLYQLALVPMHHDEGVNGFFLTRLYREHFYRYDPANYHGPTLYYLTLPLTRILGLETATVRLLPALFGIGVLWLLLVLGHRLGGRSGLYAAALVAVSPGMVYISRYFIHEMLVVFFTLGVAAALAAYTRRYTTRTFFAAVVSAGFLFATKETAAPTAITLVIAAFISNFLLRPTRPVEAARGVALERQRKRQNKAAHNALVSADAAAQPEPTEAQLEGEPPHRRLEIVMWALVVFVGINGLLYSSFYSNKNGFLDAFRSLRFWSSTGGTAHVHPWWQYVTWMLDHEGAILVLGWVGIISAIARRANAFAVFCAFWSVGVLSLYSLIPYKTPWLTVNIILPFAIMAGYELGELEKRTIGVVVRPILAGCVVLGLIQCIALNFVHYDDDRYDYVYAHTVRDINRLLVDIEAQTWRFSGQETRIVIVTENYWPLPWEMRNYPHAEFFGKIVPLEGAQLVIAEEKQDAQVRANAGTARWPLMQVGKYVLRGGVDLVLWARAAPGIRVPGIDTHGKRQEIARVAGVTWQAFGGFAACDFFRVLNVEDSKSNP